MFNIPYLQKDNFVLHSILKFWYDYENYGFWYEYLYLFRILLENHKFDEPETPYDILFMSQQTFMKGMWVSFNHTIVPPW